MGRGGQILGRRGQLRAGAPIAQLCALTGSFDARGGNVLFPAVPSNRVDGAELLSKDRLAALVTRTANGGAELVGLLKTGSAYYAPAASVVEMVEAILKDKKKVLPCAAYLEGEYGMKGLFVGVPAKLGRRGIEQILQITLSPDEAAALGRSAAAVRELTDKLGI